MNNFVMGVFVGLVIFTVLLRIIPASNVYKYIAAIEACENSLPRDQNCKINAIPKEPEDDR